MQTMILLNQGATLFLLMLIGFIAQKGKILDQKITNGLMDFLLYVTFPATIIRSYSSNFSPQMLLGAGIILLVSLIIHLCFALLSLPLYTKSPRNQRSVLQFVTTYSNASFMGFPIMEAVFGEIGIFYASIYVVPPRILLWTLGVSLFAIPEKNDSRISHRLKRVLLNPGILAVLLGLPLFIFSIKLPAPITNTLKSLGSMTTPLAMVIIGARLGQSKLEGLFSDLNQYYCVLMRLIVLPVLTYFALSWIGFDRILLGVCVLAAAMPAATTVVVVAGKYNGDSVYASRLVFITTLFSMFTIPLFALLVQV